MQAPTNYQETARILLSGMVEKVLRSIRDDQLIKVMSQE